MLCELARMETPALLHRFTHSMISSKVTLSPPSASIITRK